MPVHKHVLEPTAFARVRGYRYSRQPWSSACTYDHSTHNSIDAYFGLFCSFVCVCFVLCNVPVGSARLEKSCTCRTAGTPLVGCDCASCLPLKYAEPRNKHQVHPAGAVVVFSTWMPSTDKRVDAVGPCSRRACPLGGGYGGKIVIASPGKHGNCVPRPALLEGGHELYSVPKCGGGAVGGAATSPPTRSLIAVVGRLLAVGVKSDDRGG